MDNGTKSWTETKEFGFANGQGEDSKLNLSCGSNRIEPRAILVIKLSLVRRGLILVRRSSAACNDVGHFGWHNLERLNGIFG